MFVIEKLALEYKIIQKLWLNMTIKVLPGIILLWALKWKFSITGWARRRITTLDVSRVVKNGGDAVDRVRVRLNSTSHPIHKNIFVLVYIDNIIEDACAVACATTIVIVRLWGHPSKTSEQKLTFWTPFLFNFVRFEDPPPLPCSQTSGSYLS